MMRAKVNETAKAVIRSAMLPWCRYDCCTYLVDSPRVEAGTSTKSKHITHVSDRDEQTGMLFRVYAGQ